MRLMGTLLSDIEIQRELGTRQGWARRAATLTKTYEFPTFLAAIAFVNRAAEVAERLNHHPDIDIRYSKVSCHLSTHSAGGITRKDFSLAAGLDAVATEP
jgi:4a-hydroxytetrahydrobiopterin dehydratase